jgi:hypothetical protein
VDWACNLIRIMDCDFIYSRAFSGSKFRQDHCRSADFASILGGSANWYIPIHPPPLLLPLAPLKHGTHVAPDASMKWDIQRRIIRRRDELKKRLADTSKWIFYKVWTCKRLQLYIFTIVYFCYFFNYIELLIFSSHIYVNMIYYNIYYIYQCHTVLTV